MYPIQRHRRLRTSQPLRDLVSENALGVKDLVLPMFVMEGKGLKENIPAIEQNFRYSIDTLIEKVQVLQDKGIRAINLYAKVPESQKDNTGKASWDQEGLLQRAVYELKKACPSLLILPDVALDPFSIYGHDGIIEDGKVHNDKSNEALAKMAVSLAEAGADLIAPSDMMDGRVLAIRTALDASGFQDTGILSYTAKYASAFYGPFRSALDSAPVHSNDCPKDKKTYQMDPANSNEALREAFADIEEGADILMVKPGLPYLDIIKLLKDETKMPIAAFNVSGEYAMLKAGVKAGLLQNDSALMEMMISFKRAGADLIFTYAAEEIADLIKV